MDDGYADAVARALDASDRSRHLWRHRAIGNTRWAVMATGRVDGHRGSLRKMSIKVSAPVDEARLVVRTAEAQGLNTQALLRQLLRRWLGESGVDPAEYPWLSR